MSLELTARPSTPVDSTSTVKGRTEAEVRFAVQPGMAVALQPCAR